MVSSFCMWSQLRIRFRRRGVECRGDQAHQSTVWRTSAQPIHERTEGSYSLSLARQERDRWQGMTHLPDYLATCCCCIGCLGLGYLLFRWSWSYFEIACWQLVGFVSLFRCFELCLVWNRLFRWRLAALAGPDSSTDEDETETLFRDHVKCADSQTQKVTGHIHTRINRQPTLDTH